jgi:hypothetical protein
MFPNPLRDQAHFSVVGDGIARIRVHVFDLSGQEVFTSSWVSASTLVWEGVNNVGERLANGVYLYFIEIELNDGLVKRSKVKQLVILR